MGTVDVLVLSKTVQPLVPHPLSSEIALTWACRLCSARDPWHQRHVCAWQPPQHGSLSPLLGRFIIFQVLGVVEDIYREHCVKAHTSTQIRFSTFWDVAITPDAHNHITTCTHHPALRSVTTLIALKWLISYKTSLLLIVLSFFPHVINARLFLNQYFRGSIFR